MNIYAKDKNIPTYAFGNLFVQGEHYADKICFFIDRFYGDTDLLECNFLIRGVNEKNDEAAQVLLAEVYENNKLRLIWKVSDVFTACSGKLNLELRASKYDSGIPQVIVKYNMQPVYVQVSPKGENIPLPDTAEQIISEITEAGTEAVKNIREEAEKTDILRLETEIENCLARPEIIALTQKEYDSTGHKQNVLYVITGEE